MDLLDKARAIVLAYAVVLEIAETFAGTPNWRFDVRGLPPEFEI